jgi:dethiobiotin synthetase
MLSVVTGTGTGIGKTHFGEALLQAAGKAGMRVAGVKPVESGVSPSARSDAERLASVSTFHVKPFGYAFADPVSPHLAARLAGCRMELASVVDVINDLRSKMDLLLLELPGGLFTPLTPHSLNIDLAAALVPEFVLLAAPDRLGVLHDVVATTRAARVHPLTINGIVLIAPSSPDPSTGRNQPDLVSLTDGLPVVASLPWAPATTIAESGALSSLLSLLGHAPGLR